MTLPAARPPGRLVRWAAILLPIVIGLRALLLLFQISGEHHPRQPLVLPWPPVAGERLPFESGNPGIRAWAAQPDRASISAALIEKNGEAMPADTGCMLNPEAMADGGGTLTLQSAGKDGAWTAHWSGYATVSAPADVGGGRDEAVQRQIQAAMLDAADCGASARLEVTQPALHRLVAILNHQPPPPPGTDPVGRTRELKMRVQVPSP